MVAVDRVHSTSFRKKTTRLRSLIRLQQRPLLGLLVNPFGTTARVIELDGHQLRITKRGQTTSMSLQALSAPPAVRKGALGAMLTLPSGENDDIILRGASNVDAKAFSDGVKDAWINFNLTAFEKEAGRFERIHAAVAALSQPSRYPAACSMTPLLTDARSLDATLLSKLQLQAIGPGKTQRVAQVRKFVAEPARWKEFFDTIESKPLTAEQRLSVVVDDDATLVLAGAGSGKTSVITAKAAYLVKAGIRQPEEILLLAFARNAAAEMSERVEARSGVPIVARTFHALAYDIIGMVEGSKPALADHATDDAAFTAMIKQILKDLVHTLSEVSKASMDWKRKVHAEHETTLIETYSYERQEGHLLTGLAEKITPHVTWKPRPADTIYDQVIELKQVNAFSQMLGTFLRKYKSGGYSLQHCETKSERLKLGKRAKAFLAVFAPVFEEYQKHLGGRIDCEDMFLRAAHYTETGRYVSPFRHILVDEFQDISQSRARLVKALKGQHPDVRMFAVGDDWQSIFRFAGSDIHLMRHFGTEFGGNFDGASGIHRTVDLGRTFRSVDQIAFAARTFVLRNPAQIQKQIVPAGTRPNRRSRS